MPNASLFFERGREFFKTSYRQQTKNYLTYLDFLFEFARSPSFVPDGFWLIGFGF